MTQQRQAPIERLALVLVYGALPVLLLGASQDDGWGEHVATALFFAYGASALPLLATTRGRDACWAAVQHQQRTIGRVLRTPDPPH